MRLTCSRHAREQRHAEKNEQRGGEVVAGSESRAHHQELALEQAERRHADNREHRHEKCSAGDRHHAEDAALEVLDQVGA